MKKLILTALALVAGATLVHAQAWLEVSSGVAFGITTNTGTFGNPSVPASPYGSIVSGQTLMSTADPYGFDYAFLYIPTGIGTTEDFENLADGNWVQLAVDLNGTPGPALLATNVPVVGNFEGQGGRIASKRLGLMETLLRVASPILSPLSAGPPIWAAVGARCPANIHLTLGRLSATLATKSRQWIQTVRLRAIVLRLSGETHAGLICRRPRANHAGAGRSGRTLPAVPPPAGR
jgi:hypothetical protein